MSTLTRDIELSNYASSINNLDTSVTRMEITAPSLTGAAHTAVLRLLAHAIVFARKASQIAAQRPAEQPVDADTEAVRILFKSIRLVPALDADTRRSRPLFQALWEKRWADLGEYVADYARAYAYRTSIPVHETPDFVANVVQTAIAMEKNAGEDAEIFRYKNWLRKWVIPEVIRTERESANGMNAYYYKKALTEQAARREHFVATAVKNGISAESATVMAEKKFPDSDACSTTLSLDGLIEEGDFDAMAASTKPVYWEWRDLLSFLSDEQFALIDALYGISSGSPMAGSIREAAALLEIPKSSATRLVAKAHEAIKANPDVLEALVDFATRNEAA